MEGKLLYLRAINLGHGWRGREGERGGVRDKYVKDFTGDDERYRSSRRCILFAEIGGDRALIKSIHMAGAGLGTGSPVARLSGGAGGEGTTLVLQL